ncbi:lantibiotic dehydratase [Streptomyces sp. AN091965]|uniref:lantibiotic dehydratase n=1 Tax=Streptomyces sp. AN091965 TaxID=2927803 RepID=UPI001F614E22|nr:lantibiotic dehydratase [Streptomyces sp. AN091965]MCI3934520.1 lantibiotic dehydratase [Streptomyces sp. AN091965]
MPRSHSPAHPAVYRPAGFFLLRTPTLTTDSYRYVLDDEPRELRDYHSAVTGDGETELSALAWPPENLAHRRQRARARLLDLAEEPLLREAVQVASPSLFRELERMARDGDNGDADERVHSSLLRYVARMSTRPTPFGLFAQVGAGEFGDATRLARMREAPASTRTRADVGWLLTLIRTLEGDRFLRDSLRVVVNPCLYRSGGRLVLPVTDVYGQSDNRSASVRTTRAVDLALRCAEGRPSYAELIARMRSALPGAGEDRIRALVDGLWDLHILTSDLRPATTDTRPERALLERIQGVDSAEPYRSALERTHAYAARVDEAPRADLSRRLSLLDAHQRSTAPDYERDAYQVDATAALLTPVIKADVAEAAADAAETLLRLGLQRSRPRHLAQYHQAFVERYGVGAEVPVLQLLNAEQGLDAPETYSYPPRSTPLPPLPEHGPGRAEQALASLTAAALHQGRNEIEITDAFLETWDPAGTADPSARPSLDVTAQIASSSKEALDRGEWKLVLSPAPLRDGGRLLGRFSDVLGHDLTTKLRQIATAEEALCPEALFVELSYVHQEGRGGNLAIHPSLRSHEICVNTSPSGGPVQQILLSDVLVGATDDRLYLRSATLGRELRVTQSHVLNPYKAPNICRFLLEVSDDGFAQLAEFDWGLLDSAPVLPRVSRGRVVLRPARWRIDVDMPGAVQPFTGALPDRDRFFDAFQEWRRTWRVPKWVCLSVLDNKLLLDLDHPLCVDEIHRELRRTTAVGSLPLMLEEMLPDFSQLWLRDPDGRPYASEIVVPLLARDAAATRRPAIAAPVTGPAARRSASTHVKHHLVGGDWAHLKVYAALGRHDDIISGPLPAFVQELREEHLIDRWFFIRYCDPHPHLRIRLRRAPGTDGAPLLHRAIAWARTLVDEGLARDLAVVAYDRETERYGGPEAIETLEAAFEAGSDAAAALVGLQRARPGQLDPDVVGVFAMDTLSRQWGAPASASGTAGDAHGVSVEARTRFRALRATLCDLLAPWDAHPDPTARLWADDLGAILARQSRAVARAGQHVRQLAAAGRLVGTEDEILRSLLHMQSIRLSGVDRVRERRCHDLWALALRSLSGRPDAPEESRRRWPLPETA